MAKPKTSRGLQKARRRRILAEAALKRAAKRERKLLLAERLQTEPKFMELLRSEKELRRTLHFARVRVARIRLSMSSLAGKLESRRNQLADQEHEERDLAVQLQAVRDAKVQTEAEVLHKLA